CTGCMVLPGCTDCILRGCTGCMVLPGCTGCILRGCTDCTLRGCTGCMVLSGCTGCIATRGCYDCIGGVGLCFGLPHILDLGRPAAARSAACHRASRSADRAPILQQTPAVPHR